MKLSVVTIVWNDVENIEKTMHSVMKQTYLDFEYVIKDGLSDDGTTERIKEVQTQYPDREIKLIRCKDSGIYDAMNQAVAKCNGEWIIFINSGDSFYNNQVLSDVFNDTDNLYANVGLIYGDAMVCDEAGKAIWEADISKIERKMPFCHQSCFIKKSNLERYPFDTSLRIAADYNQILDMYVNNVYFKKIDKIISIFELDGVSSTKFTDRFKERNLVIMNHGINNRGRISLLFEYCMEIIKTILVKIVPTKLLLYLKNWYKANIKHYKVQK